MLELDPSGSFGDDARARILYLNARDDDAFAMLSLLEHARRIDPENAASLEELRRRAYALAPSRALRSESLLLLGDAYLRLGDFGRAKEAFLEVVSSTSDEFSKRLAATRLYEVARLSHDDGLARRVAEEGRGEPWILDDFLRARRRGIARTLARCVLVVYATLAAFALVRMRRSDERKSRAEIPAAAILATMGWIALGGVFANNYETGSYRPFLWFAIFSAPLLVATTWIRQAFPNRRALLGSLAALSILGAAFLVLDRINPAYLRGFSL